MSYPHAPEEPRTREQANCRRDRSKQDPWRQAAGQSLRWNRRGEGDRHQEREQET